MSDINFFPSSPKSCKADANSCVVGLAMLKLSALFKVVKASACATGVAAFSNTDVALLPG